MKRIINKCLRDASVIALGVMCGRIISLVVKHEDINIIMQSAHVSLMTGFFTAFILLVVLNMFIKRGK